MDWKRRLEFIPNGISTESKMLCRHVEGVYPETIEAARGAYLFARPEGGMEKGYIDYECGLGSVVLGHANRRVNQVVMQQMADGGTISVASRKEGELAERICELVPSAQMVRFTNTGTEACMAAIKIARAATGRERVLCCGYHGWGSWYTAQSPHNLGCTEAEKQQIQSFTYNNIVSFEKLLKNGPPVAAVIMEPYVLEQPKQGYLRAIRDLCTEHAAVLIFDEVVTGFRTQGWTAQKMFNVIPDLTALGKCMANGIAPISCVCGRRDLMMTLTKGCFVSSTFAANPIALTAALETIKCIEEWSAIDQIWRYGEQLIAHFENICDSRGADKVRIAGYPCRTFFYFPTEAHKSLFWQECLNNGVWFGYAQFVSYAHTNAELDQTITAMKQALDVVMQNWKKPEKALKGKVAEATFRMAEAQKGAA